MYVCSCDDTSMSRRNAVVQTPFPREMLSRCKAIWCRSLKQPGAHVRCWMPQRPCDCVEHTLDARSHADERISLELENAVYARTSNAWLRMRGARARKLKCA